jgi:hypothetical protein
MRRLIGLASLSALLAFAGAGQAQGATTFGSDLAAPTTTGFSCFGGCTFMGQTLPGRQTASPVDGVIVRWRIRIGSNGSSAAQPVALRLIRSSGGVGTGVVAGQPENVPSAAGIYTFGARIPVTTGDYLAINCCDDGMIAFGNTPGASMDVWNPPLGPTETRARSSLSNNPGELLVNADVEADADRDGFGDETQDGCPTEASTQGACPAPPAVLPPVVIPDTTAPDTTISSGPKKTDSPKVAFGFSSSEAGSTFACSLTGKKVTSSALKRFGPCTSKKRYKRLKPGRYAFLVAATDAAGNADPTPAKRKFKILE